MGNKLNYFSVQEPETIELKNGISLIYEGDNKTVRIVLKDGTEIIACGSECGPDIKIENNYYMFGDTLC